MDFKKIVYCGVEPKFVNDYIFEDVVTCYEKSEYAKEYILDYFEDIRTTNDITGYIAKVKILGDVFNIFNKIHRGMLLQILPQKIKFNNIKINKELYVLYLLGNWYKDTKEININFENSYTAKYWYNDIILNTIDELGFDGYVIRHEDSFGYVINKPNVNLEIVSLSV